MITFQSGIMEFLVDIFVQVVEHKGCTVVKLEEDLSTHTRLCWTETFIMLVCFCYHKWRKRFKMWCKLKNGSMINTRSFVHWSLHWLIHSLPHWSRDWSYDHHWSSLIICSALIVWSSLIMDWSSIDHHWLSIDHMISIDCMIIIDHRLIISWSYNHHWFSFDLLVYFEKLFLTSKICWSNFRSHYPTYDAFHCWLFSWLIDFFINWLISWLIDSFLEWLGDSLIDLLILID